MSEDKQRFTPKRDAGNRSARSEEERPEWQQRVAQPINPNKAKSPLIPDEIKAEELPLPIRVQLKTLTEENAERVARHLAMVSLLIDQDTELAQAHAMAAVARASRIGLVHEFAGAAAYANGDFALALRELQTHRRITGSNEQIALIVDCERGLGRPDKALAEGRGVDRRKISGEARVNLAIALSGARLDKGEDDLALAELEIAELTPTKVHEYTAALFFAYSDVLEALGRKSEAKKWLDLATRAEKEFAPKGDPGFEIVEEIQIPVRRDPSEYERNTEGDKRGDRRPARDGARAPRQGGDRRAPREGGERRAPREGGERRAPREGSERRAPRDGAERKPYRGSDQSRGRDAGGSPKRSSDRGQRGFGKRGER
jgi:tetratricopeptide (TPR) repeat protein